MNDEKFISWNKLQEKWLTRRNLIRGAAGTAAGAGLLLGSGMRLPALADDDEDKEKCGLPLPLPHTTAGPSSTITNFEGFVGNVDLTFSGTGMDTKTGATAPYQFHTDTRFMKGVFIASDERRHHGTFAFI